MLNKVILIGYVNSTIYDNNGYKSFFFSTKKIWKDKNGEKQEKVSSHKIMAFNKFDNLLSFIDKKDQLYIEGELSYYQKDENSPQQASIIPNNIHLLQKYEQKIQNTQDQNNKFELSDMMEQNKSNSDNQSNNNTELKDDEIPF